MARQKWIVDTDAAGDDCMALLLGLCSQAVDLLGITTVAGNLPQPQVTENALYTVQAAGRSGQVPVFRGCDRPLLHRLETCEHIHGDDGMGNSHFPPARQRPAAEHGVDALVRLTGAHPGEVDVLAIGPLTNLAVAYMKDPGMAARVRRLWVMGGTVGVRGNVTPVAEFNFYVDPEAAKMVFQAGFPITLVDWGICIRHTVFGPAELDEIAAMGTPLSRFFLDVNRQVLKYNREQGGIDGTCHPDAVVAAMALDPRVVTAVKPAFVDIAVGNDLTRGYSAVDLDGLTGRAPNAEVVQAADAARFRELMFGLLR